MLERMVSMPGTLLCDGGRGERERDLELGEGERIVLDDKGSMSSSSGPLDDEVKIAACLLLSLGDRLWPRP